MAHYHVRVPVGDRGAAPAVPSVKAPTAKPPRIGGAKPPAVPKTPSLGGGGRGGGAKSLGEGGAKLPSLGEGASAVGQIGRAGAGLVNAASRGVSRVAEFGEEFNRDSGGRDQMGHYHFNIPTRGARRRMGDTIEKPKKTQPYLNESTSKVPWGKMRKPSSDSGTSEGAKKAAQTRAQGGGFGQHPLAKGGGFSIHGTEGTQRQAPKHEEPREEFRGYDTGQLKTGFW